MYKPEFFEPQSPTVRKRQKRLTPEQIERAFKQRELRVNTDIDNPTEPFIMTPRNGR